MTHLRFVWYNRLEELQRSFLLQLLLAKYSFSTFSSLNFIHPGYSVDFLLSRGSKLWPIEVKSEGYKTHASLDKFCEKFSERVSNRYLVYTKDLHKDEQTLMIPVYMVGLL